MKAITVEWVYPHFIKDTPEQRLNTVDIKRLRDIPVVRLPEVDALLKEAVWAMEQLQFYLPDRLDTEASKTFDHVDAFLASRVVKEWEKRQEELKK